MSAPAQSAPVTLEGLYRAHVSFAWRTARYLGVSAADAQDVVHEVFLIARRRLDDYDPSRSARAWLAGITRRVVMHHHRNQARTQAREAHAAPPTALAHPEERLAQEEAEAFLLRFLASLPEEKRDAFVLGELEQMTAAEIGDIVGANPNTVASRLRSARKAFQAAVDRLDAVRRREGG